MTRVRTTASLLLGLLLAGALAAGCSAKDPAAGDTHTSTSSTPSAPTSPSTSPPAPKLSASQTLAQALDRMERKDLQGFVETVRANHVAALEAWGVVRLSTGELRSSARFMDPDHTEQQVTASAVLAGHHGYLQSSMMPAPLQGCWLRILPAQMRGAPGIVARGMGLTSFLALRAVQVTGIDRFHQQVHGRLPLERAVLLFAPVLAQDLVGLDAPLPGSVPVSITVADGQVLDWAVSGTDVSRAVVAAVGDRVPSASMIAGTEFGEQFSAAGRHDEIAAPADADIATGPAGCHGTAT